MLTLKYGKSLPEKVRSGRGVAVYGSNGPVGEHGEALVEYGALIVGRKGSVGEVHQAEGAAWPIDTTYYIDEFHGMPMRYWYWVLRHLRLGELNRATAIPGLNREDAYQLWMDVPPVREQERIAERLNALLARVDACRDRLDRVPAILKRFRQAVLSAATSGALTEEYRAATGEGNQRRELHFADGRTDVPACWHVVPLNYLNDPKRPLCYGVVQPGDEASGGVPLIRVQDMTRNSVAVEDLRTISTDVDHDYRRSRVKEGDVLVSVVGTIGRTALVPHGLEANIARAIARVSCGPNVLPTWLQSWLAAPTVQWWLLNSSREVARKTLNLSELARVPVALPPVEEQTEIGRRVSSLFALAESIESRLSSAQAQVERLTPALLAKAFRGELVPQDPNDEPASAMLERLRASPKPAKRTRR